MAAVELSRDELCNAALDVVQALPEGEIWTAWVSGSLVEKLGNPSSDVDIFVVKHSESPNITMTRRGKDHDVLALIEGDIRYDIEFWQHGNINTLRLKLDQLPIDKPQQNNLHFLSYWESEFIHRLLVGWPLLNKENFISLRSSFNFGLFCRFLMDTAIRRADDAFDDAVGMYDARQMRMAALRARDCLQFSADALIHAHGVTNDKSKFRLRKIELLANGSNLNEVNSLLECLWCAESYIPNGDAALQQYVEDTLRNSSKFIESAQKYVRFANDKALYKTQESVLCSQTMGR